MSISGILECQIARSTKQREKDLRHCLGTLLRYLDDHNIECDELDWRAYEDYLVYTRQLKLTSVRVHLATLQGYFKRLVEETSELENLLAAVHSNLSSETAAEMLRTMLDAADVPLFSRVARRKTSPRRPLSDAEVNQLLASPGVATLEGVRDTVVIAMLLGTGVRDSELGAIKVEDVRQVKDGEPALHVPNEPGCFERLVAYGEMAWVLDVVGVWLEWAEIAEGPAFRGFYSKGQGVRPTGLSSASVRIILVKYPVLERDGELVSPTCLDLRRTYARRLLKAGASLDLIRSNLGLKAQSELVDYIEQPKEAGAPYGYTRKLSGLLEAHQLRG